MTITLRPYQSQLKSDIYSSYHAGAQNVLGQLPTGGGKSIIVSDIALDQHRIGASQVVIAHRTELVSQMSLHIARRGIPHRIIGPKNVVSQVTQTHRSEFNGKSFVNPRARAAVGGVDTILARQDLLSSWASQIDFWTIDEAHHVLQENKWGKVVNMFSRTRGLGVRATPQRADGKGLGRHHDGVFDALCEGPTMRELIDMGALCDYQIVVPESDFQIDKSAVTASGDFSRKKMADASKRSRIVGDVVVEYLRYASGKRGICFATDVETAHKIADQFNASGVPAAAVDAKTPTAVRQEYVRRFKSGQLLMLVNVDLFGEGFDVPACEVVIMARPTSSVGLYLQMFGRALRIMEGKQYGLIIDHVSNWKRHGFPDKHRIWTLDRRDKRAKSAPDPDVIDLTSCKSCTRPYEKFHRVCPYCGHEPVPAGAHSIEQVDGDLMLLDRATIAKMMAQTELERPDEKARRTFLQMQHSGKSDREAEIIAKGHENRQVERLESQERLRSAINQWAGIQRWKGRPDYESHRRFYLTLKVDVLTALTLSRKEMDRLSEKIEGWCVL